MEIHWSQEWSQVDPWKPQHWELLRLLFIQQRYSYTFPFKLKLLQVGAQGALKKGALGSGIMKWGNDRHEKTWACKHWDNVHSCPVTDFSDVWSQALRSLSMKIFLTAFCLNSIQSESFTNHFSSEGSAVSDALSLIISWKITNPL